MNKSPILALLLLLAGLQWNVPALAQREISDFDRDWRFARFGMQADGNIIEEPCLRPSSPAYTDTTWRSLDLPHDWGIESAFRNELDGYTGKLPWQGIGWYRKHFRIPSSQRGECFYVDFDGAMANAEIWLNGIKIGERPYGYSSFRVDLTPHLHYDSDNVLAVRLDTEQYGSRWYPGAGIYRHVRLVRTAPLHVGHWGVFVTTPEVTDKKGTACIRVTIDNRSESPAAASYTVSLHPIKGNGQAGKAVATSARRHLNIKETSSASDSIRLEVRTPRIWSLEKCDRYVARIKVFDAEGICRDTYDQPFGFRTIAFTSDNGFHLNGKRVQIQGVCMHHDLGALGAAINETALRRQLTLLKTMGCNAIRTSHNPPAPELPALADEMGFLIMDEAFDCWQIGKNKDDYSKHFDHWHEKDIRALVCRDRNHPSVILWSLGNEVREQYEPQKGLAAHLREVVRRYDTTRPVTLGISGPKVAAMNGTELQLDVVGTNYPAGIQGGEDFFGKFFKKKGHEHLPVVTSESASTLSSRGEYFPRPYQVNSYDVTEPGWASIPDHEFRELDKYPAVAGEFVWTGFDYLGEPTPFNSDRSVLLNHTATMTPEELAAEKARLEELERNRPTSRSSYFGIFDMAGFPKDRFYLYQSRWLPKLPMAHILPHWNFPERTGQVTPVQVYTSGDEAELFLNGRSLGKRHKGKYEYRLQWDSVIYEPGRLDVVVYKDGKKWAKASRETTGPASRLALQADKRHIKADGRDLVFVTVSVTDAEGRIVPTANMNITCQLEGKGEIVATDNGDATCHTAFSSPERPAFNGLLLAIIRAGRDADGELRLTVKADGLESASLSFKIKK